MSLKDDGHYTGYPLPTENNSVFQDIFTDSNIRILLSLPTSILMGFIICVSGGKALA
jgi:hypothetical protein